MSNQSSTLKTNIQLADYTLWLLERLPSDQQDTLNNMELDVKIWPRGVEIELIYNHAPAYVSTLTAKGHAHEVAQEISEFVQKIQQRRKERGI